jgi:intracellular multiplication protein IcmT
MAGFTQSAHWRDSSRPTRFFIVDARAAFPLILCLMHIKIWSIILAVIATAFFGAIEYYGFSVIVFSRYVRTLLAGPRKVALPWWKL